MHLDVIHAVMASVFVLVWIMVWQILSGGQRQRDGENRPASPRVTRGRQQRLDREYSRPPLAPSAGSRTHRVNH